MALWTFHLVNLALAALMYTMIGRLILEFLLGPDNPNFILRAFARITDPAVHVVRAVTPSVVPALLVQVLAVVWLIIARVGLAFGFAAGGFLAMTGNPVITS